MVPPTESLRFVAGELGKSGRNLEEIVVLVVVVVFTLKSVLTSIQYPSLSYSSLNFRGDKLTQNKVQKNKIK